MIQESHGPKRDADQEWTLGEEKGVSTRAVFRPDSPEGSRVPRALESALTKHHARTSKRPKKRGKRFANLTRTSCTTTQHARFTSVWLDTGGKNPTADGGKRKTNQGGVGGGGGGLFVRLMGGSKRRKDFNFSDDISEKVTKKESRRIKRTANQQVRT